jgi:hypothetical protein
MIPGELYFTTRGIAEIQSFYTEDGTDKVRFWLHSVDKEDGVTADGGYTLMSTIPTVLQEWIDDFPRDIEERRCSVAAIKDRYPQQRDKCNAILERIKATKTADAQVKVRHFEDKKVMP